MDPKGYYKILNLNTKCTEKEIEDSYCEQAIKYHPDKNQGKEEMVRKFQAISEAYETLKDKKRREDYDSGLNLNLNHLNLNNLGSNTTIKNTRLIRLSEGILNTIIDRYKKDDNCNCINASIKMSLEQIHKGANRIETVQINNKAHLINVIIEPGCPENHEIRVNKGDVPVLFTVTSKPHHIFKRKGHDLYMNKTMSLREYINGFEFVVPLLDGKKKKIEHSYGGTTLEQLKPLKLAKCGMPRGHGGTPGDMYINIAVKLPRTLKQ